jgi:cohesin loading factor subunit SCC2
MKSARIIAGYLIQRSGSSRTNKTAHDTDYKAILEIFVGDLLNVLYRPEWPAAALFLNVMSRILVSSDTSLPP